MPSPTTRKRTPGKTTTAKPPRSTTAARKVSLDDLDDQTRAALLAQAKSEIDAGGDVDVEASEAAARARTAAIAKLLDSRDHLRGCPADGRVEAYGDRKPAKPDRAEPAKDVTVIRCIECGGSTVMERPYADVMALVAADVDDDVDDDPDD